MRKYDFKLGRFRSVDALWENYRDWNGYQYAACDPVNMTDANGYKIDVTQFLTGDFDLVGNNWRTLVADLKAITGLIIDTTRNAATGEILMTYKIDSNARGFSDSARTFLMSAIDNPQKAMLDYHVNYIRTNDGLTGSCSEEGKNMSLCIEQIESFINGTVGVNNKTMGWGMTFLHELGHTVVGGSLPDDPNNDIPEGAAEANVNFFRNQLTEGTGSNWGRRMEYAGHTIYGEVYIPFDSRSKVSILRNEVPELGSYIHYPIPGGGTR